MILLLLVNNEEVEVLLKTLLSLLSKEEKLKIKKFGAHQPRDYKFGQMGKESK
jgi:hypothetical protein